MATFQYNALTSAGRLMKGTIAYMIISLLMISTSYAGRALSPIKLTIDPTEVLESNQKYQLLPKAENLIDADAVPLYTKAIQSLPSESEIKQIRKWLDAPLDQLPLQDVQSMLPQLKPILQLIEQASKCKQCTWPPIKDGRYPIDLSGYRKLTYIVALQAHFHLAQKEYESAISTIKAGLAMARHVSIDTPYLAQGLVGVAIGSFICREIEQLVQAPDSPNLHQSLTELPITLVDLSKAMQFEKDKFNSLRNILNRKQSQATLKLAHDKIRLQTNFLDRKIAALQCIEALRLYAGAHDGKFPGKLSDVTEVKIPNDPVTDKPFSYTNTGTEAVLELEGTEVPEGRDAIRYELKLKE